MTPPFYTIGHSTRSISEFVGLLQSAGVTCVADVRTVPRSRKNPHYNSDTFSRSLAEFGVGYEHIASLGGLRGHRREVPPEVNAFWENQSFHNYADYAMGEAFQGGLTRLGQLARTQCCAIMCAEAVWWRCHRRIITDYLIAEGKKVLYSSSRPDGGCLDDERSAERPLWSFDLSLRSLLSGPAGDLIPTGVKVKVSP
jgi:uncharacterized protein (DUF488 family)